MSDAFGEFLRRALPRAGWYLGSLVLGAAGAFLATSSEPLGLSVAAVGGLLLAPILRIYVAVTSRHHPRSLWMLRVLLVVAVPLNLVAFARAGLPHLEPPIAAGLAYGLTATLAFAAYLLKGSDTDN